MSHPKDVQVRPVAPGDESQWRALWTAYLDFYETRLADEVYTTTFARLLDDDPRSHRALVAETGRGPETRLVGLAHYLFHRHAWRIEEVCYLQDLYAVPDLRGTGIGRALIEGVYDAADRAGAGQVYWLTHSFNDTARRLYDRVAVVTPFIKYQRP